MILQSFKSKKNNAIQIKYKNHSIINENVSFYLNLPIITSIYFAHENKYK